MRDSATGAIGPSLRGLQEADGKDQVRELCVRQKGHFNCGFRTCQCHFRDDSGDLLRALHTHAEATVADPK